ncbi:MAG: glycosyltransferase family 2 protein [Terriglobales bacterium]
MKQPSISVVVAAHDAGATLAAALRSALQQSLAAAEIVVVDDGSNDNTAACASRFGSPVRCLRQRQQGPAAARNAGIAATDGEWVAFLDADDGWTARHLEASLAIAVQTGAEVVCSDAAVISGQRMAPSWLERSGHGWLHGHACGELGQPFLRLVERGCFVLTSTVCVRRELLEGAGGFDVSLLPGIEDLDLWLRLARHARWAYNAATRIERNEGGGNLSARPLNMTHGAVQVWSKALQTEPLSLGVRERKLLQQRLARAERELRYCRRIQEKSRETGRQKMRRWLRGRWTGANTAAAPGSER